MYVKNKFSNLKNKKGKTKYYQIFRRILLRNTTSWPYYITSNIFISNSNHRQCFFIQFWRTHKLNFDLLIRKITKI